MLEKKPMYRKFYLLILLLQLETIFNQDMLFVSHLSVTLALQRSNETYKYIKRPIPPKMEMLDFLGVFSGSYL